MALIEITDEDFLWLKGFIHDVRTQDNRATARPVLFHVRTFEDYVGPDGYGDRQVFVDLGDGEPTTFDSKEEARKGMEQWGLSEAEIGERMANLEELSMHEVSQLHNCFFTEKGYKKHMELNGHNYRGPRLRGAHSYVTHAFRNPEVHQLLDVAERVAGATNRMQQFYEKIAHGDAEHRKWLREEFERFWGVAIGEPST